MERAGSEVRIRVGGTPIAFVDEATSTTDNRIYKIIDNLKTIIDYNSPLVVMVGGTVCTESYLLDLCRGSIIFGSENVLRGAVTLSGNYVTTSVVAYAHKYSLKEAVDVYDVTRFIDTYERVKAGKQTAEGKMSSFDVIDTFFIGALRNSKAVFLEFDAYEEDPDPMKMWAIISEISKEAEINGIQDSELSFKSTGAF